MNKAEQAADLGIDDFSEESDELRDEALDRPRGDRLTGGGATSFPGPVD